MDIVVFAEKFMNIELFEWQKQVLRDLENLRSEGDIRIVTGRKGQVYIYLDRRTQKELIQHGTTPYCHN